MDGEKETEERMILERTISLTWLKLEFILIISCQTKTI